MTPDFESRARVLDLDLTRSSVSPDRYASEATHSAWRLYLHLQERATPVTPPQNGALANSGVPLTSASYQHRYLTEALARTETMADHRGVSAHERFEALFARPHGLPVERLVSNTRYESFETEWAFRAWAQAIASLDTWPAQLQEQVDMLGRIAAAVADFATDPEMTTEACVLVALAELDRLRAVSAGAVESP